ncbi:hypothetical protein MRX96_024000 [Rhipicephalus microplus]
MPLYCCGPLCKQRAVLGDDGLKRLARRKLRDPQQCISQAKWLSAVGQAGSSELAFGTTLSSGGDVAESLGHATADEAVGSTECSDSASAPTSVMYLQERQEVCGFTCAALVVNLGEQMFENQAHIRQPESDIQHRT